MLNELPHDTSGSIWHKSASEGRIEYLYGKMLAAVKKIAVLERENAELKKILVKGG